MSAVFLLSAGKASHMKPRNRIDLIILIFSYKYWATNITFTNSPNNKTISTSHISRNTLKAMFMYDLNFSISISKCR